MQVIDDFIAIARKEIGYKESGVNITKYNEWADENEFWFTKVQGLAWCGTFVAWCFWELADKYHFTNGDICLDDKCCWVDHWAENFSKANRYMFSPIAGDLAFKNGHMGIVVASSKINVTTIEGNYNDKVDMITRRIEYWLGFGRPKWDAFDKFEESPFMTTDDTMAKQFVINQGIYIGKEDGDMHWKDNLTREEMAIALYRYWKKFNK